jgi:hypothetical protein
MFRKNFIGNFEPRIYVLPVFVLDVLPFYWQISVNKSKAMHVFPNLFVFLSITTAISNSPIFSH